VTFLAGGLFVLALPGASARLLAYGLAATAVLVGATDLWIAVRIRPLPWTSVLMGVATIGLGAFVVLMGETAFEVLARVLALLLAFRGGIGIYTAIRSRRTSPEWTFNLVKGGLSVAAAAVIFVVPEAIETALLLTIAAAAITSGAIMVTYGLTADADERFSAVALGGYVKRWLGERDVGDAMRMEVINNLYFENPGSVQKQVGFWVLLILSTTIATFAILADSTAVVIGAMLVAPLMTPILGVAAAIVNGWMLRVTTSFLTVVGGVAVSIFAAWIVASWAPALVPLSANSQVLSRVSPTLLDMMIAVAAGAAGAYATVDKRVSASITGVAIAVALVPPLGVVGVTLQAGHFSDASGAFVLFVTNLVSIILAASIVFVLTGFALITKLRENHEKMKTIIITVVLGVLVVMVPLAFTSEGILTSSTRQSTAQKVTEVWIEDVEGLRLNRVTVTGTEVAVVITGEGIVPSITALNRALSESMEDTMAATVEYFPSEELTVDNHP
jgi:uncharacterized hydrophobic protein (TIGR00271 family)